MEVQIPARVEVKLLARREVQVYDEGEAVRESWTPVGCIISELNEVLSIERSVCSAS